MRSKPKLISYFAAVGIILTLASLAPMTAFGAGYKDYCVKPPLIGSAIPPNLLMIIDNSASMYDLTYQDLGTFGVCSSSGSFCAQTTDCPLWNDDATNETCGPQTTRTPTYCYDETFNSNNIYEGYFTRSEEDSTNADLTVPVYYSYDFTNQQFVRAAALPANTSCVDSATGKSWYIAGNLCLAGSSTAKTISSFVASGNYLNWLSMSKFDIQKKVLTGGKYDATNQQLIAESRGCVGRKYIKEPLTANFVNYADGGTDTNTGLGVTFGINGPVDPYNATAPSPGGQTSISVFLGDYNQANCEDAIAAFQDPTVTKNDLTDAIEQCLGYEATNKKTCTQDSSMECNQDSDCLIEAGTCGTTAGTCPKSNTWTDTGTCATSNAGGSSGTCSVNNGTCVSGKKCVGGTNAGLACTNAAGCPGGSCANKTCGSGGKAGAACNNDADCAYSACSNVSKTCTVNSDCDVKTCGGTGTTKDGASCTAASDCSYGKCTDPVSMSGTACLVDSDCNAAGTCTSGPYVGAACTTDTQCSNDKGPCAAPVTTQIKSTFAQSMHSCYQSIFKGQTLGSDEIQQISNAAGCNQIYKSYFSCFGGSKDGQQCYTPSSPSTAPTVECGGGACIKGPSAIRPGNPILVCSTEYAGYCASSSDNWNTTVWVAREYADADACILAQYNKYCGATQVVPVIDPSTPLSTTSEFANLPAILNDIGVEAQLGAPVATMQVKVNETDEPTSLLQQFSDEIRMGVMTFNLNGTVTECKDCDALALAGTPCTANDIPCPKQCSTSPDPNNPVICGSPMDCPSPATATCTLISGSTTPPNQDAAKILHYIGTGICYKTKSITTGSKGKCVIDADCNPYGANLKCISKKCSEPVSPQQSCVKSLACNTGTITGRTCVSNGAGSHASGLVKAVDDIKATSWTPFSEAYYDAIGYLATDPTDSLRSRTDLRINTTDFDADKNPSEVACQRNTILLITDGMSTADQNPSVMNLVNTYFGPSGTITTGTTAAAGACEQFSGSQNLDDLAYLAKNYNITKFSTTAKSDLPLPGSLKRAEQIQTFVAFNGTESDTPLTNDCNNKTLLEKTATNGGSLLQEARNYSGLYQAINNFFQSVAADTVSGTAASVLASGEGSGANLVQAVFYPTKTFEQGSEVAWLGRLSNMWYFVDPNLGNSNIREDNGKADPSSSIVVAGDKILNLQTGASSGDYITQLYFDGLTKTAKAHRWGDSNGDAIADSALSPDIRVDDVANLWEAGKLLWSNGTGTTRTIWTYNVTTTAKANNMIRFATTANVALKFYMQQPSNTYSSALIKWVLGDDKATWSSTQPKPYRQRQAYIGGIAKSWKLGDVLNSTPKISTWQPLNTYHTYSQYQDATYGPVNGLYEATPASDASYVTTYGYKGRGNVYAGANDGMLHAFRLGKLKLDWTGQDKTYQKAMLANGFCASNPHIYCQKDAECPSGDTCSTGTAGAVLGEEIWAYIPKNVLPYLPYMANPNYCHIYSVDLTPFIFDASISKPSTCSDADYSTCPKSADTWNTILIGGMRLGGGCRMPGRCSTNTGKFCTADSQCPVGQTCLNVEPCTDGDCVYTPRRDPMNGNKGVGYSSYFALDITNKGATLNQNNPKLLWEFDGTGSDFKNYMGFATSGPAIVRINSKTSAGQVDDKGKQLNGKWFVVFGSGPTGPIDTINYSFMGRSDQNLRLFVFDLAQGPGANNANVKIIDTGITKAFAGNMVLGTFDVDRNYADEVVYVPYIYQDADGDFNNGGIGRLLTHESTDPNDWEWSVVINNTGPLTTGTAKLKRTTDSGKRSVWLFFGAGRFFYSMMEENDADDSEDPDSSNPVQRQLFGFKDPCIDENEDAPGFLDTCPAAITFCDSPVTSTTCGGLTNVDDVEVTKTIVVSDPDYKGWYVDMEPTSQYPLPETIDTKWYYRERTITDPAATSSGIVYFTSFRPYKDPCEMGGMTHLWAMLYDTGGDPTPYLKGKAIIQVSTGSIEQIDLATAFTEAGHRKTAGIVGVPPTAQGISVMAAPGAAKRPVHIRER